MLTDFQIQMQQRESQFLGHIELMQQQLYQNTSALFQ